VAAGGYADPVPAILAAASDGGAIEQGVQVLGALLILVAFVASQLGRLNTASPVYLWLNLVGSAVLAVLAALGPDWGFLLLEGAWALVSAWSLWARARAGAPARAH
jgi:membrane-bound ClpP family serine protease